MEAIFRKYCNTKSIPIIFFVIIGCLTIFSYESIHIYKLIFPSNVFRSTFIKRYVRHSDQNCDDVVTFERQTKCNYQKNDMCYSTNKSLVITFWHKRSIDKWVSQNILSSFPLHSFDHMIFVHDNSSWHTHPGYKHFIWIHVDGQFRFWYIKRFVLPMVSRSYEYLWIIDDDAQLNFSPLNYQCVTRNLNISLSAPGRLSGVLSHDITKINKKFKKQIGRWTNFIETGPIVIISSSAWQCLYMYLDAAAVTGWGFDYIWCNIIAQKCLPESERKKACAVLDVFSVDHQSASVNSVKVGKPEIPIYVYPYKIWLTKQRNLGPLAEDNQLFEFCTNSS